MPNGNFSNVIGKPHLDGHLSIGARRVIGDMKRTLTAATVSRHNPLAAGKCT
jgi:hypothetical protein